jgi:hypothetical protein
VYRRQRRTIQPRRHHCGICRGTLQELGLGGWIQAHRLPPRRYLPLKLEQLSFTF